MVKTIISLNLSYKKARKIVAHQKFLVLGYIDHIYSIIELYFSRNMRMEGALMVFFSLTALLPLYSFYHYLPGTMSVSPQWK